MSTFFFFDEELETWEVKQLLQGQEPFSDGTRI